jgi:hypothetical protein
MRTLLLFILCLFVGQIESSAQVDTVNAKNNKLQLNKLKEETVDYLVYFMDSVTQKRTVGDLWRRKIQFTNFKDQPAVLFTWNWIRNDTAYAIIVNICDRKTLAPIYRHGNYKGRGIMAYDYREGVMVPSDTIQNNLGMKKGNTVLSIPVLSWELDMETYALLPIKKVGQKFDISFFDPNEKAPTYHRYEVIGTENLQLNSDVKVKCWLLKINYSPTSHATFWLSEKSKEVLKMQEYFNGKYRLKVRQY